MIIVISNWQVNKAHEMKVPDKGGDAATENGQQMYALMGPLHAHCQFSLSCGPVEVDLCLGDICGLKCQAKKHAHQPVTLPVYEGKNDVKAFPFTVRCKGALLNKLSVHRLAGRASNTWTEGQEWESLATHSSLHVHRLLEDARLPAAGAPSPVRGRGRRLLFIFQGPRSHHAEEGDPVCSNLALWEVHHSQH